MKREIISYKIDEGFVLTGIVTRRGSNNYIRFCNRVDKIEKELGEKLESFDVLKSQLEQANKVIEVIENRIKEIRVFKESLNPIHAEHLIYTKILDELRSILDKVKGEKK